MTVELDDVAARAFASIVLERTADTLLDGGSNAAAALAALQSDSGMVWEVCAGILQATSWLAGTGELDPAAIFAAALALKPDDDEAADTDTDPAGPTDPVDPTPDDPDDPDTDTDDDWMRRANEAAAAAIAATQGADDASG